MALFGSARTLPDEPGYEQAREVARMLGEAGFAIITGGGPGMMQAANQGAREAGAVSVGLNIELPFEQRFNPYVDIALRFHYFFTRKVMFVRYSCAFVVLPGGYGTMDELFEALTLIQTGKILALSRRPAGQPLLERVLDWPRATMVAEGKVSERDFELLQVADDAEHARGDRRAGGAASRSRLSVGSGARNRMPRARSALTLTPKRGHLARAHVRGTFESPYPLRRARRGPLTRLALSGGIAAVGEPTVAADIAILAAYLGGVSDRRRGRSRERAVCSRSPSARARRSSTAPEAGGPERLGRHVRAHAHTAIEDDRAVSLDLPRPRCELHERDVSRPRDVPRLALVDLAHVHHLQVGVLGSSTRRAARARCRSASESTGALMGHERSGAH